MNALGRQTPYTIAGRKIIRPRTLAMIAGVGLPVGYVIAKHVSWEKKPDSKLRMLIHQSLFWGSAIGSLYALHRIKWMRISNVKKTVASLGAMLPTAAMFEGGEKIARLLVPKRPDASPEQPTRYIPSFIRQQQQAFSAALQR